ncbi:MAG TPA: hypothetical protein VMS81_07785, partial [Methanomicrobiales archaeon]|nr:hypothetical protein [Methanomicrobiales archaeon]
PTTKDLIIRGIAAAGGEIAVDALKERVVSPQARWEGPEKGCTAGRTFDLYLAELVGEGKVESAGKGKVRIR